MYAHFELLRITKTLATIRNYYLDSQPRRLVLGLLFFAAPVACFTCSAALSTGWVTSRLPAGVSLCSAVLLLAGDCQ